METVISSVVILQTLLKPQNTPRIRYNVKNESMQWVSQKVPLTTYKTQPKNKRGVMQVWWNVVENNRNNIESLPTLTTSDGKQTKKQRSLGQILYVLELCTFRGNSDL
jgi:hypothetical protein